MAVFIKDGRRLEAIPVAGPPRGQIYEYLIDGVVVTEEEFKKMLRSIF